MRIENSFEVAAPPEEVWSLLMDVPRVVPCMPGAELTETVDESHWKANMSVKLGPMKMTFATDVAREAVDEADRRVMLATKARELRGRGGANATVESSVIPLEAGTRVEIVTDLRMSGTVAQFGGAVVQDVAGELTRRFAECLQGELAAAPAAAAGPAREPAAPRPARPVSGLSLAFRALAASLGRLARRLLPGSSRQ